MEKVFESYMALKEKYPDAVLLFRVDDKYFAFGKDSSVIRDVVGATPHAPKNLPVLCAFFKANEIDSNLPKLVRSGHRVALCDELVNPDDAPKDFSFPGKEDKDSKPIQQTLF